MPLTTPGDDACAGHDAPCWDQCCTEMAVLYHVTVYCAMLCSDDALTDDEHDDDAAATVAMTDDALTLHAVTAVLLMLSIRCAHCYWPWSSMLMVYQQSCSAVTAGAVVIVMVMTTS